MLMIPINKILNTTIIAKCQSHVVREHSQHRFDFNSKFLDSKYKFNKPLNRSLNYADRDCSLI